MSIYQMYVRTYNEGQYTYVCMYVYINIGIWRRKETSSNFLLSHNFRSDFLQKRDNATGQKDKVVKIMTVPPKIGVFEIYAAV